VKGEGQTHSVIDVDTDAAVFWSSSC